jgi:MoaA/NifB/PqqE/SkfB family radical SAM enzyme
MDKEKIEFLINDFGSLARLKFKFQGKMILNPFRYSDPLVCKDLELILDLSKKYNISVQITTNAVSFNDYYTSLLEKYVETLNDDISISVLGTNETEVKNYMDISLNRTIANLEKLSSKNHLKINKKIFISLREISGTEEEFVGNQKLQKLFANLGFRSQIKKNWIHNRVDGISSNQTAFKYINGCKLYENKLLRRLEVMVNGDVVLCDDDAEGRKVFGNIFEEGIHKIWNGKLFNEHRLIFENKFSDQKLNLICKNCSRAVYSNEKKINTLQSSIKNIGKSNLVKQLIKGNVNKI